MIELRDYQKKLVERINDSFRRGIKRSVAVSPTGSGKTIIFSYIASMFDKHDKKVLLITHRRELLIQSGGAFEKFDINSGYITAGNMTIPPQNVVVAMVETINRRLADKSHWRDFIKSFYLIIIDEGHIGSFDKLFKHFDEEQKVLGFTATAYRRKPQRPLKDYYNNIIIGPTVKELIQKGYLTPSMVFGRKLDMKDIGVRAGEYKAEDQHEAFKVQGMYGAAIEHYRKLLPGKKTLAFTPSVESSKMLVEFLNASDIPAAHVDGETPKGERKRIFELFHEGEINVLSNVDIATTGFDEPGVEGIILLLATRSLVKYLQILGRGSRIFPGKDYFTVLDFGSNTQRHGFYEDDREWSLELNTTDFRKEPNTTKICPNCNAIIPIFSKKCPHCGHIFTGEEIRPIIVEEMKIELAPLKSYEELLAMVDGKSFYELDVIAELKGWKKGWIYFQLQNEADLVQYLITVKGKSELQAKKTAEWLIKDKGWRPLTLEERIEQLKNN